ncbi:MAG: hypothetical protein ABJ327_18690 [Litoreibacter sp.]
MKTVITLAAIVLAPVAASAETAAEIFALNNDSAAERILGTTSIGDVGFAKNTFALDNNSAAERIVGNTSVGATKNAQAFFALNNDSAAERIVK